MIKSTPCPAWRRALDAVGGVALMAVIAVTSACGASPPPDRATFADDLAFLQEHTDPVVLETPDGLGQVAVAAEYQGRVMTSTARGPGGVSFGWINRGLIALGERQDHINALGGEDRMWLGPEGGQFSIFFAPGDPFDLDHWQTPAPIDWGPWDAVTVDSHRAEFATAFSLTNYSGARFDVEVVRAVSLLEASVVADALGVEIEDDIAFVAYETDNRVTNSGSESWVRARGLLSIWILGMFAPSPSTTVVIPFEPDAAALPGDIVNDAYFGQVPPERLKVDPARGVLFFRGDGAYRSKIGIRPAWARPLLASYDASVGVLTFVTFNRPEGAVEYVNSMWELQDDPYAGDVSNSYNDGPPAPGAPPLGPFYELESSSPALALAPGETGRHVHRTMHFQGPPESLEHLARQVLGLSLAEIQSAL